jgi:amino acid transporter
MPFGIIGSLLICTILYILVSIVMTLVVNYKMLNVPGSGRGRRRRARPPMELVREDHQGRVRLSA